MRLRQLQFLLAIVDSGLNVTAAAERLFTSQPGVSKQLKLLEEELKLKIFTRKGKSLEAVTAEGEEVIRRARSILRVPTADFYAFYMLKILCLNQLTFQQLLVPWPT